jgi:hypothetical protein
MANRMARVESGCENGFLNYCEKIEDADMAGPVKEYNLAELKKFAKDRGIVVSIKEIVSE